MSAGETAKPQPAGETPPFNIIRQKPKQKQNRKGTTMRTSDINETTVYENNDERLGDPGTFTGAEILEQIAMFGDEDDTNWDIEVAE